MSYAAEFERDAQGIDFPTHPTRPLRDHLATGGGMVEYLAPHFTPQARERSRIGGMLFEAFLDCLFEKRPYSLIVRPEPEPPGACMARLVREAKAADAGRMAA